MKESLDYTHRLSNIKLPLGHKPEAIRQAVLAYLNLEDQKLRDIFVYRRGYDARKKAKIHFIYTLDLSFAKDVDLAALEENYHLQPAPNMLYQPVFSETVGASYTEDDDYQRPVVIGTGPCGLFAALTLAQHGLKPLV